MTAVRKWSLLTAIACVVVLAAGWLLLVSPQRSDADLLQADAVSAQEATARLRTQLTVLKSQAAELPAQQARLTEISSKLPDNPALPPLIRALTVAAETAGVTLVSVAPSAPTLLVDPAVAVVAPPATTEEGAPPATTEEGAPPAAAAPPVPAALPLAVLPLKLEVVGDYYGLEAFIAALEDLQRSLLVTGLAILPGTGPVAAGAAGPGATEGYDGNLKLTLDGRVFLTPAPIATPAQQPVVAAPPSPAS